jgi:6-phosphogluconolactonase (cycloisomerase 2 family)
MALDGKGQFLFVLNPTSGQISMYQIGQTVGLSEVPSSPFSANTGGVGPTSATPVCLAAEKSGHFLYVGFEPTNPSANGEIVEYAIDAAAQQILMDGSVQTPPGLIDCVTNQQNFLYVGLKGGGAHVYTIGQLQAAPASAGSAKSEVSIAVDPQGHYFFDGWGGSTGFAESAPISPAMVRRQMSCFRLACAQTILQARCS